MTENRREFEGVIEHELPRGLYAVRLDDGRQVTATMTSQSRRHLVKIISGDRVLLELSEFDNSRGRIKARVS